MPGAGGNAGRREIGRYLIDASEGCPGSRRGRRYRQGGRHQERTSRP